MTTRESNIYTARAYLAQVPLFRAREQRMGRRPEFSLTLLQWAGNARREAMATTTTGPVQGQLFGV